ncbi:MAG: stage V sporulation T C-terminal domain-containing protein [Bacilli bacterium]
MKATGIIRRIDELGRIVIPKEIRKTLRIKEGENLEIFVDEQESIILKKYSLMQKMNDLAQDFADAINSFVKYNVFITDNDIIMAVSGPLKKTYLNKNISEELESKLKRREEMIEKHPKSIKLTDDKEEVGTYAISPIIVNGDATGLVLILSLEDKVDDVCLKISQITSKFLKTHLEQ